MIGEIFKAGVGFTNTVSKAIANEILGDPKADKLKDEIKLLIKKLEKARDDKKLDLSMNARSDLKYCAVRAHNQIYTTSSLSKLEDIKADLEKVKKKYKIS